jgi:hypothetical protein
MAAAGGLLDFVMGPEPNKNWAGLSADLPPSTSVPFTCRFFPVHPSAA